MIVFFISSVFPVPMGSPSHGGDVAIYVFGITQLNLPTPFYSALMSLSAFMALSTVFHSTNSSDNSPLSHSVLPVLFLPFSSFHLYLFLKVSLSPYIILCGWLGLKHQLTNWQSSQAMVKSSLQSSKWSLSRVFLSAAVCPYGFSWSSSPLSDVL